jgi:hypothetical protein
VTIPTHPYCFWHCPQVGRSPTYRREVPTLEQAQLLQDAFADYDLFQFENRIKPDYCNTSGIEMWDEDEQEWLELDEDDIEVMNKE